MKPSRLLSVLVFFALLSAAIPAMPEAALPPDHWLVGTSDVADMVPATIAEEAPRKLLAEEGPAYLEQIGKLRVLHLKGTPYEMGRQHGVLMKGEVQEMSDLMKKVGAEEWHKNFAESMREVWNRTSPFIPEKYKEEIRGVAEATGIPIETAQGLSVFPELFHCSGFAVWGKATADGSLLHARVLDYMRDIGLEKYALIIITEPDDGNAVLNVSYSGFVGSVTGMNNINMAMGEMGGAGDGQWDGMPMGFLLRECLETGKTLEDMRRTVKETPRTCQYFYVLSDAKADNGRGSAYGAGTSSRAAVFFKGGERVLMLPDAVEDAVMMSAGARYTCLVNRTRKMYGKITPQVALDIMARGVSMASNTHNALFKPDTLDAWISYAVKGTPSCNLPYTHINMGQLLKEKPSK